MLPRQSPRTEEKKELKPSNRPPAIGRSSNLPLPRGHYYLKGLNERVSSLDARLTEDGASLSQAKVYALKKQLARAKADEVGLKGSSRRSRTRVSSFTGGRAPRVARGGRS